MGGLGPGIGGGEYLLIAIVALVVVGPERLPMLLNKLGKLVAKARGMANEFRASFDEMARQSELDELRKEVDALRRGQGMYNLGPDADAAFRDISTDLNRPQDAPAPMLALTGPDEWPDTPSVEGSTPVKPHKAVRLTAKAKAKSPPKTPKAEPSIKIASGKRTTIRAKKVEP